MLNASDLVVWNNELRTEDKDLVGREISDLGELSHHNIPILHRIVVTPHAYATFLEENNLTLQIKHLLGSINYDRHDSLYQIARYIRNLITRATVSSTIYKPLFSYYEKMDTHAVTLNAHYFRDGTLIGSGRWENLRGESVLVEHVRIAYAQLFAPDNLQRHGIHHLNHHTFKACLFVVPEVKFDLTGYISTHGKKKGEYEIEAHEMVRFSYNKHLKRITSGEVLPGGKKDTLTVNDLKKLLHYAHSCELAFYLPQVMYWGKLGNDFLVTKILPLAYVEEPIDSYSMLIKNVTVHPGVTIGRLRVIDEKHHSQLVVKDEIVSLRKLDKDMVSALKTARGIILEEEPNPEVLFILKNLGIPTVVKKGRLLYSTGDVVSLNATTGEIKRGSMLVS